MSRLQPAGSLPFQRKEPPVGVLEIKSGIKDERGLAFALADLQNRPAFNLAARIQRRF